MHARFWDCNYFRDLVSSNTEKKETVYFTGPKEMDYHKHCVQTTKKYWMQHILWYQWRSLGTGLLADVHRAEEKNKNIEEDMIQKVFT